MIQNEEERTTATYSKGNLRFHLFGGTAPPRNGAVGGTAGTQLHISFDFAHPKWLLQWPQLQQKYFQAHHVSSHISASDFLFILFIYLF